jgi:drug/metabolite transporter (DMT)-like permease
MGLKYIVGVVVAMLSGVINNLGVLLQKKVVNDVPPEHRDQGFMKRLVKNPLWLIGLFLQVGIGMAAFVGAQALIGPTLVPGLMASGLIVLAIGSVKLMREKLSFPEYVGIFLMVIGIALLGLSEMDIDIKVVEKSLESSAVVLRIGVFTAVMLICFGAFHLLSLRSNRKGIIMGFANGFLFSLSNFWISPLTAIIAPVLSFKGSALQVVLFAAACVILTGSNILAFSHIQIAFKYGQASNIIPVQQLSVQITPVLVYFFVFSLTPPKTISGIFIVTGALLIILAGFLLGQRQEEIEKIK